MSSPSKDVRKAYYARNKDKIKERQKENYLANRDKLLEYQRAYRASNKEKILDRTRNKRRQRLELGIKLLGGKCVRCNGQFDPCQYDFHHLNPDDKDFTIGENVLVSEEKFINEVKKCILLCANCHRLEHKEKF